MNLLTLEDDRDAALDLLDVVIDEGRRTAARLGFGFDVLVYARRNADPASSRDRVARPAEKGVVSFGLAGDKAQYAPEPFAGAFVIACDDRAVASSGACGWSGCDRLGCITGQARAS